MGPLVEVRLPKLGERAEGGTVITILVKIGQRVSQGDPILEVESEKAVVTVPSPASGVVEKIFVREGDEVKTGALLLLLSSEEKSQKGKMAEQAMQIPDQAAEENRGTAPEPSREIPWTESPAEAAAAPSVRWIADQLGIDLRHVQGTGRGGRVLLEDLRGFVSQLQRAPMKEQSQRAALPMSKPFDLARFGPVRREKMSQLRKTIASRMQASWQTIPHVFQMGEADITSLNQLRKKYQERYRKHDARLTMTALLLPAVIAALREYPVFNASLDAEQEEIVYREYLHLNIAVDTKHGLIAPVLKDVDKKDLLTLARDLDDLAARTKERKLKVEELEGGTFSISNLGGIWGSFFTPIITQPQVAVLGVSRAVERFSVEAGKTVARSFMPLVLSYDHRVIDGADAARFMKSLTQFLEAYPEHILEEGFEKTTD